MIRNVTLQGAFTRQPVIDLALLGRRTGPAGSLLDLPFQFMTQSGRSALRLALELSGVRTQHRVLAPTYHCPTMIAPIRSLDASPVWYPLNAEGEPDISRISQLDLHGVKAMVAAHLFGIPISMKAVAEFCRDRDITLIEDCAHCFAGTSNGTAVGTFGKFAIGSLPKFFPVTHGGLLASAYVRIPSRQLPARSLSNEAHELWDLIDLASRAGRLGPLGTLSRLVKRLRHSSVPTLGSVSPDCLSGDAAIARDKGRDPLLEYRSVRRLDRWIVEHSKITNISQLRRRNYIDLANGLANASGVRPLWMHPGNYSAPYVMPLFIDKPDHAYQRMRAAHLPVFRWDRVWPGTPQHARDPAVTWSRHVVQIACHQSLRPADVIHLIAAVSNCLD